MVERVRAKYDPAKEDRYRRSPMAKPGHERRGGRAPGTQNKNTRILKEAVLMAAELQGRDGRGKDGLVGYLRKIANAEPKAFCMLLARILPLQITSSGNVQFNLIKAGVSEKEAVAAWIETMQSLKGQLLQEGHAPPPMLIEHDSQETVQ